MNVLIEKLLIFIALMLVGYAGARRGTFNRDFTRAASALTLNVFTSATVLNSVISNPPQMGGAELAYALLVCLLTLLLSYVVAFSLTRLLPIGGEKKPLFEMLIAVMNPMFIGVPVAEVLIGEQGVFYIALGNVFFNLLLFTYGVWRIKGGQGGLRLKDIVSPLLICTVLAVVIFILRIPVPGILKDLIGKLSGATMPMSMVVIGASMGRVRLKDAFSEKTHYLVSLVRLLVMPLLAWLLFLVLPCDPVQRQAMLILSACPSGVVVSILAVQYGKDAEYCAKCILLDTMLSMLTIPLLAQFLF